MASSSNGNGNVMDEFEEAFQACLHALTKQESTTGVSKEEIELEVEQTAHKFIDLARQMETFFLQKRFLISVLKPEMLLKDENQELRLEITRKDALISKHYQRLEQWKGLLSDQQTQTYNKSVQSQQSQTSELRVMPNTVGQTTLVPTSAPHISSGIVGMSPAQLQQQHLQVQQQQQQLLQAQQIQQMQQMQSYGKLAKR
uniref:Mediator of RNA polymerase II transcription subunit 28 n=1 Tax=Tabanus bromius TaxID=304241 RepID=A0A0K8TN80_TABBR